MQGRKGEFETGYQSIGAHYDEDNSEILPFQAPEATKTKWNHIQNLDEFFTRVYKYHQKRGFLCIFLGDVLDILQFLFVMTLTSFLAECVDYSVLFGDKEIAHPDHNHHVNNHTKISIADCIKDCSLRSFHSLTNICLVIAGTFWVFRIIKALYHLLLYLEIRSFYSAALKVSSSDLHNMTWHEVQKRVIDVQAEHQMCIHKSELTQLDIYHRILRFKNYSAAMVNKNILPIKFLVPFVGESVFLTTGYKYNLDMILFWGPWAPFANSYHLKEDYKNSHKRKELADELARRIFYIGLANFILCPVILLWQILYSFYNYAEMIKREPGFFGARSWSHYGTIYLRHFNELDHEFATRLSRGYKAASRYMAIFLSHATTVIAKSIAFFCGSILSVLVILTVIDEDVLTVEHILTIMTILAAIVSVSRQFIPDEHLIWCPEKLLMTVLSHIHYMPDHWKGNAHTWQTRDEFSQLFQYKFVHLLEELLSPIITPFVLCFSLKNRALDIVDFFRNFTVEVVGVGDVCSFAQMDVKKHGNPEWTEPGRVSSIATQYEQAENGKTELSLMHFHLTNPDWKPPVDCSIFLNNIKEQAQKEATLLGNGISDPEESALFESLTSLSEIGPGYKQSFMYTSQLTTASPHQSMLMELAPPPDVGEVSFRGLPPPSFAASRSSTAFGSHAPRVARGAGVNRMEGPLNGGHGVLASLQTTPHGASLLSSTIGAVGPVSGNAQYSTDALQKEMALTDMGVSAMFLHELHFRRKNNFRSTFGALHRSRRDLGEPGDGNLNQDQDPGPDFRLSFAPPSSSSSSSPLVSGTTRTTQATLPTTTLGASHPHGHAYRSRDVKMEPLGEEDFDDAGPTGLPPLAHHEQVQLHPAPFHSGNTSVSLDSSASISGLGALSQASQVDVSFGPAPSAPRRPASPPFAHASSAPLRVPFLQQQQQQQQQQPDQIQEPKTLSSLNELFKSF